MSKRTFHRIFLTACLLVASFVVASGHARAVALNPDPGGSVPDYVRSTLLGLPYNCPQSPGFSYWISPPFNPGVPIQSQVLSVTPGTEIWLQYNWSAAICSSRSAVLLTTLAFDTGPGIRYTSPGLTLDYRPDYNRVGKYVNAANGFFWTVPSDVPYGISTQTINIGVRRINLFSSGQVLCVNPGPRPAANFLDFSACGSLSLPVTVTVYRKPPDLPVLNNPVANCQSVSGSVANADNVTVQALLDGVSIGTKNLSAADGNYSFVTPDRFKDGQSHTARIILRRTSDGVQLYVGDYTQKPCTPNAVCGADFAANIQAVFPGNIASLGVGDTIKVKVTMTNNGESIWTKAYGNYELSLTPAASTYWSMSGGDLTGTVKPIPDPISSNTFIVNLQLIKSPTSASTPLQFQMRFTNGAFGGVCATTLRIQADYNPWLRVQNGNVAALGTILGQKAGSRGGYKAEGAGQDVNLDAQYAIAAYATTNSFCSANAYNYGRGDIIKCDFDSYKFNLPGDFSYLLDPASTDKFVDYASSLQNGGQCTTTPGTSTGQRYRNGGSISAFAPSGVDFGTLNTGGPVSSCPLFIQYGTGTASVKAPAVINGASKLQVTGGRATIIVHGDLQIKTDIVYSPAAGLSVSPRASGDYDEAAMNRLPNLGIIVDGNVIIDGNVKQIDAAIYASGSINTCDFYPRTTGALPPGPSLASKCANKLAIRGGMFARKGFSFGRNYYDVAGISSRPGVGPVAGVGFDYNGITSGQTQGQYYGGPAEDILGNGLTLILAPPGFENITKLAASEVKYLEGNYSPRF